MILVTNDAGGDDGTDESDNVYDANDGYDADNDADNDAMMVMFGDAIDGDD